MLQVRGRVVLWVVIGALALAGSALAGEAPAPAVPAWLQAPVVVAGAPAPAQVSPVRPPATADPLQPVFLTLGECRAQCYSDFQACKAAHNLYSFCLELYNECFCGCNDSCNP